MTRKTKDMDIPIKHYIEQGRDKKRYKGYIIIADVRLNFSLVLPTLVDRAEDLKEKVLEKPEVLKKIELIIKRVRRVIELTGYEREFFLHFVLAFAEELHSHLPVRFARETVLRTMHEGTCRFRLNDLRMLSQDKFGCQMLGC